MTSLILLSGDLVAEAGGYTIAAVGYFIVFIALIVLVGIFMTIPKILQAAINNKLKKANKPVAPVEAKMDANINVAIAMGLYLYFNELHDEESNIITIKNAQKQYSPWNSKIYGVQNQPQIKR